MQTAENRSDPQNPRRPACDNTVVAKKSLEQLVRIIAEDQLTLKKLIADLARETRKDFDRIAKQFRKTGQRKRPTDKNLDKRIDKLIADMGEFTRQSKASRQ